jgi:hypothetical protein
MAIAETFVVALAVYMIIGLAFAIPFLLVGVQRIDAQARGAGVGFRLLILPGAAAFWPLLLTRWIRGLSEPPVERNPHRKTALTGGSR